MLSILARNPWGQDPLHKLDIHSTKYEDSPEAKAPIEHLEFIVPTLATSNGTYAIPSDDILFEFAVTVNVGESRTCNMF